MPEIVRVEAFNTPIEITSMPSYSYDPTWSWVDRFGHEHHVVIDEHDHRSISLATWMTVGEHWCDDCEEFHTDEELRCVLCMQEMPRIPTVCTDSGMYKRFMPGLTEYIVTYDDTTENITAERYKELFDEAHRRASFG